MPIYAYRCASCGHARDVLQKLSDPVLTLCPACGEPALRKQLTAAGFQLKGSGWYATDFRNGNAPAKPDGEAKDGAKPDGGAKQGTETAEPSAAEAKPVAGKGAAEPAAAPAPAAAKPAAGGSAGSAAPAAP